VSYEVRPELSAAQKGYNITVDIIGEEWSGNTTEWHYANVNLKISKNTPITSLIRGKIRSYFEGTPLPYENSYYAITYPNLLEFHQNDQIVAKNHEPVVILVSN
jgi:hypothetical protein